MIKPDAEFVLSRHWQETDKGIECRFWLINAENERTCFRVNDQNSTCFVDAKHLDQWTSLWQRQTPLVTHTQKRFKTLMGDEAVPVYSRTMRQQRWWVRQGRDLGLKVWEDDINPAERYLMERFLFGSLIRNENQTKPGRSEPKLRTLSIDIETAWFEPGKTPDLYSIALVGQDFHRVIVVDCGQDKTNQDEITSVLWVPNIADCLQVMIKDIQNYDPDCIIGWNVIDFDLRILQEHCDQQNIIFSIGREQTALSWRVRGDVANRYYLEIEGRQVVDGPGAFRSAAWSFDDFSLETVSRSLL